MPLILTDNCVASVGSASLPLPEAVWRLKNQTEENYLLFSNETFGIFRQLQF
jgi:hypothetical protein